MFAGGRKTMKKYFWGTPDERLIKNGKVMCPKCLKNPANISKQLGVMDCDVCKGKYFSRTPSTAVKPFFNKDSEYTIGYNKRLRDKQIAENRDKTEKAAHIIMEELSDKGYSQGEADHHAETIRRSIFGNST